MKRFWLVFAAIFIFLILVTFGAMQFSRSWLLLPFTGTQEKTVYTATCNGFSISLKLELAPYAAEGEDVANYGFYYEKGGSERQIDNSSSQVAYSYKGAQIRMFEKTTDVNQASNSINKNAGEFDALVLWSDSVSNKFSQQEFDDIGTCFSANLESFNSSILQLPSLLPPNDMSLLEPHQIDGIVYASFQSAVLRNKTTYVPQAPRIDFATAPSILSVSPSATPGSQVEVSGKNFLSTGNVVYVDNTEVGSFSSDSTGTKILFTLPSTTSLGDHSLTVKWPSLGNWAGVASITVVPN